MYELCLEFSNSLQKPVGKCVMLFNSACRIIILNMFHYHNHLKILNNRGIGRTDAEAEAPILWPPDAKN